MAAVITGVLTFAATLAAAFWGPLAGTFFDRQRRARELRNRYSPPLLQAAFDLQSRFYNIVRVGFLQKYLRDDDELTDYAEYSTLWLVGQYLAWVEILRQEVQFLDFGSIRRNRGLQDALGQVTEEFATDERGLTFAIFRTTQRAIGELMIIERETADGGKRMVSLGYAEFVRRIGEPEFANWFTRLRRDLRVMEQERYYERLIRVQRALVDVVDEIDPDRVRYPDADSRGKLAPPVVDPQLDESRLGDRLA